jgi:hypothetical protein
MVVVAVSRTPGGGKNLDAINEALAAAAGR